MTKENDLTLIVRNFVKRLREEENTTAEVVSSDLTQEHIITITIKQTK